MTESLVRQTGALVNALAAVVIVALVLGLGLRPLLRALKAPSANSAVTSGPDAIALNGADASQPALDFGSSRACSPRVCFTQSTRRYAKTFGKPRRGERGTDGRCLAPLDQDRCAGVTASLASRLVDFSAPLSATGAIVPFSAREEPDIAALRASAFKEGVTAGRLEAERHFEERLRDLEATFVLHHAAALDEAHERANALSESITLAFAALKDDIAQPVARILAQIAFDAERKVAVEHMAAKLADMLSAEGIARIEIAGPDDLLSMIEGRMSANAMRLDLRRADTIDVRARIDETLLETRLGEWQTALQASLKGADRG